MRERGEHPLNAKDLYLTVSMGEPFNGYCYNGSSPSPIA
jgi:hypothetical protein